MYSTILLQTCSSRGFINHRYETIELVNWTCKSLYSLRSYWYGNVAMPDIHWPDGETAEPRHGPMDGAMSKQSAVHVVRSIAWNSSNHVRGICRIKWFSSLSHSEGHQGQRWTGGNFWKSYMGLQKYVKVNIKRIEHADTYVFQGKRLLQFLVEMFLQYQ